MKDISTDELRQVLSLYGKLVEHNGYLSMKGPHFITLRDNHDHIAIMGDGKSHRSSLIEIYDELRYELIKETGSDF